MVVNQFEELFVNIVNYSPNADEILLKMFKCHNCVHIVLTDNGDEFDMTKVNTFTHEKDLEEREIGGLGIHLVNEMSSEFSYQRSENKNIVNIKVDL